MLLQAPLEFSNQLNKRVNILGDIVKTVNSKIWFKALLLADRYKLLTSSLCKLLFYGMALTKRTKVVMIRQTYNVIDWINFRAKAKRFTNKTMQKTSCYFSQYKFSYYHLGQSGIEAQVLSRIFMLACVQVRWLWKAQPLKLYRGLTS